MESDKNQREFVDRALAEYLEALEECERLSDLKSDDVGLTEAIYVLAEKADQFATALTLPAAQDLRLNYQIEVLRKSSSNLKRIYFDIIADNIL